MIAPITIDDLIEEMLEFGMCLEHAERVAPAILPIINDPRGLCRAVLEDHPLIAERIGATRRH